MEEDVVFSKAPWNTAQQYTFTLGQAITDANRCSQMLIRPPSEKIRERYFIEYFRQLRFVVMEMMLSERFSKDKNTIKQTFDTLGKMRVQYTEQNHKELDNIYILVAGLYETHKLIEFTPPSFTPAESALNMMK